MEQAEVQDVDMANDNDAAADVEDMKKRLKEMEDEAAALREMQAKDEKEMGAVQDPAAVAADQVNKEEIDSRSVFVGNHRVREDGYCISGSSTLKLLCFKGFTENGSTNFLSLLTLSGTTNLYKVDYACTPEEVQQHFQSCGTVNRVTIRTNKYGQPKGYAYVEFLEPDAVQEALHLNESVLHGRQLKVLAKRTNVPGMKQFRPRRVNPYMAYGFRGACPPPPYFYSPYGYGKAPRFRMPMRYGPY